MRSAAAQALFDPAVPFATFAGLPAPTGVLVADVSGDGVEDVICTSTALVQMYVYLGDGYGGLSAGPTPTIPWVGIPSSRHFVGSGDIDGDGFVDLVMCPFQPSVNERVRIVWGGPFGQLTSGPLVLNSLGYSARNPYNAFVADMNGDGDPEVVMSNFYYGNLLGRPTVGCAGVPLFGGGTFVSVHDWDPTTASFVQNASFSIPGVSPYQIAAGDFDGDGWGDVAVQTCTGSATNNYDLWLIRQPLGPAPVVVGPSPIIGGLTSNAPYGERVIGDFDGDGLDDFALAFNGPGIGQYELKTFPGDALAGFGAPTSVVYGGGIGAPIRSGTEALVPVADFEGDGRDDALCRTLIVRPGNLASTTGLSVIPSLTAPPSGPIVVLAGAGDLDGDGDADAVLTQTTNAWQVNQSMTLFMVRSAGKYRPPCVAAGSHPSLGIGTPFLGNAGFYLSLSGGPPFAPYAFGVATQPATNYLNGCTLWLSTALGDLVLPTADVGFGVTDAAGDAVLPLVLPSTPTFLFATAYAQAVVFDPAGPFTVGTFSLSLSDARRIVVW